MVFSRTSITYAQQQELDANQVECPSVTVPAGIYGYASGLYCAYGSAARSFFGDLRGEEMLWNSPATSADYAKYPKEKTFQRFANGTIFVNRGEGTAFAIFNDVLDS